ncbi:MAG: hypothetical protein HGB02_00810 [Chlorobiaceae bacterium]|nr:hypothetical protein [Chlorobiaceae bacterium]
MLKAIAASLLAATLSLPCRASVREAGNRTGELQAAATVRVVPDAGIKTGQFEILLHGREWRRLWTTPIEIPILDLRTFAGGLAPIEEGGDHLSRSLSFQGGDAKRYLFVTLGKDPARGLSPNLRGTALERLMRADTAAINPFAELMMAPLLEAAGVPHAEPRLVVLPRDPALPGRILDAFGGIAGTIEELPAGSDTVSGEFMGARRIIDSDKLLRELQQDNSTVVDARVYLKARLVDILVGDGDRMPDQWSWAGYGDSGHWLWVPVPIRHYQAFSRRGGPVSLMPHLQDFGPKYPDMKGLTRSARELDRRILPRLSRSEWMDTTRELQLALTDSLIAEAVRRMPREAYPLEGKNLEEGLMSRRDRLGEASSEFYRLMAKVVEIHASSMTEQIAAHRLPGGGLDLVMYRKDPEGGKTGASPIFHRTFVPAETREVRIYTGGGNDVILIDGPADGNAVIARFIDGSGSVRFEDRTGATSHAGRSSGKKLNHLYDAGPGSAIASGPHTRTATRRVGLEPGQPDSGTEFTSGISTVRLNYSSDYGALAGWGVKFDEYGFDDAPYRYHGELDGAVAGGEGLRYRIGAKGDIETLARNASVHLEAATSTLDNLKHYGLGNETNPVVAGMDETDFATRSNVTTLSVSINYPRRYSQPYFLEAGIEAKWITTAPEADSFFVSDRAQIVGEDVDFTDNLRLGFHYDSRDSGKELAFTTRRKGRQPVDRRSMSTSAALSGISVDIVGRYYPERMGNRSAFGKLNGEFRTVVPLNETRYSRIAFRVGGQKDWGEYPYFEAATIGGGNSVRGYDRNRFAGDASAYANTELRLYGGHGTLLVPILFGPLFFIDTGRVFLAGEASSQWHTGVGGGIWVAFFESRYSAHLAVARGLDSGRLTSGYGIYAQGGFSF